MAQIQMHTPKRHIELFEEMGESKEPAFASRGFLGFLQFIVAFSAIARELRRILLAHLAQARPPSTQLDLCLS
jgi:hypothetical protein